MATTPTQRDDDFLPQRGDGYTQFYFYQKTEAIYDITFYFIETYLRLGDRTRDQMEQAARSGKQNLAEGYVDGATSAEMEIKLTNVAKGSLHELRADFEDYIRTHGGTFWHRGTPEFEQARRVCGRHNDSKFYMDAVRKRQPCTICNIALILIAQVDYLIFRHIEKLKRDFLEHGGIKEEMSRARRNRRGY